MKRFTLLTGGTGFLGSHLLKKLLYNDINVILVERSCSDEWRILDLFNDYTGLIEVVNIDALDPSTIFQTYNIEGVVHIATSYSEEFNESINSNIIFPMSLLDNAVKNSVKYFINTGTISEYSLKSLPVGVDSKLEPINFYATTKISFETMLEYYCRKYGINGATLKIFTPYGSKDDETKIIPYLITKVLKKEKIIIKSASRKIDPIYIDDVTNAYLKTINIIKNFKDYNSFMIGGGKSYFIKDIYSKITKITGDVTNSKFSESDFGEARADIIKSKTILNWQPEIDLNEGLKLTTDYYREKYNLSY